MSGYNIDGDPATDNLLPFTEKAAGGNNNAVGFDLDGDGLVTSIAPIKESAVTVKAARMLNGFFDNNYLTSADWYNSSGVPKDFEAPNSGANPVPPGTPNTPGQQGSSYVNNFVTPIQRRVNFPEYVMEICRKPLVAECGPGDWVVGYAPTPVAVTDLATNTNFTSKASVIPAGTLAKELLAGTSAKPAPRIGDQRYPRRVAFLRDETTNQLLLDSKNAPVPIGIDNTNKVRFYTYNPGTTFPVPTVTGVPDQEPNALWFKTTRNPATPEAPADGNYGNGTDRPLFYQYKLAVTTPPSGGNPGVGTTQQPLLVPVLQIHTPKGTPAANNATLPELGEAQDETWMQKPIGNNDIPFNLVMAAGDSPSRDKGFSDAPVTEFNGGMPNFINTLEDWRRTNNNATARISGSFIQLKRSAYATAPFLSLLTPSKTGSLFNYAQAYRHSNNQASGLPNLPAQPGRTPYYYPPDRQFGFDVAILSQLPDLFSQQITTPSAGDPNKFYREVGRDDAWIEPLLCGVVGKTSGTKIQYNGGYAIADPKQRPSCPPLGSYN